MNTKTRSKSHTCDYYEINSKGDPEVLLETHGKKWNFLKKHGKIDTDRATRRIVKEWQEGKIKPRI